MKSFKPFPEYQTSFFYVTQLENMDLFEYSGQYQQLNDEAKAKLVARYEEDGSWKVYSKLEWGDEESVSEGLSFEQMIETLIRAENINFSEEPFDELDLELFFPNTPNCIPVKEEISLMKRYINRNNLPHDHICCLLHQIGQDKIAVTNIAEIIEERHPYPVSQKGIMGNKLFFN